MFGAFYDWLNVRFSSGFPVQCQLTMTQTKSIMKEAGITTSPLTANTTFKLLDF